MPGSHGVRDRAIVRFKDKIAQTCFAALLLAVVLGHQHAIFGAELGRAVGSYESVRIMTRRFDALACFGEPLGRFSRRLMCGIGFKALQSERYGFIIFGEIPRCARLQ